MVTERALDRTIILDTEEDIATRIAIVCDSCGTELTVGQIREEPERAVVLEVSPCEECTNAAHRFGYQTAKDEDQRGF